MVTVECIFIPLAVITAIIEFAMKFPKKLREHREFAMYRRARRLKWN